jgi:hypothetical protein
VILAKTAASRRFVQKLSLLNNSVENPPARKAGIYCIFNKPAKAITPFRRVCAGFNIIQK